jgi:thiosulfate dehydrogenase
MTEHTAEHASRRRTAQLLAALALCSLASCQKTAPGPAPQSPETTEVAAVPETPQEETPQTNTNENAPKASKTGEPVEVTLCDGKTTTTIPAGTPGTAVAGTLMAEWLRKNPNRNWEAEERERHTLQPAADNSKLVGMDQGQTYGQVTEQTVALWKSESERVAVAGSGVFHSADELGSTVGVSCDMCHPHAANTHPETYPKYQVQLGRVALLRDMINWCIQHPVRGQPLASDDPKMRALEAYIYAQRKGKTLEYGKH